MSQQKENSVQLIKKIGQGSEGVLYQAELNNKLVAVKYQKIQNEDELKLLYKLIQNQNCHIIQIQGINVYQHYNPVLEIIMELGQQNLYQYIQSLKDNQDFQQIQQSLCLQAAKGIQHLHQLGYFHRDIKPQNFMITDGQNVKLIDFGLVKEIQNEQNTNDVGSICYMAPERFGDQIYNHSVDIWALGLIFFYILTGEEFFYGNSINQIQNMILNITQQEINDKLKKIKNEDYQILLQKMIRIEKDERISIQETLNILQRIQAEQNQDNHSEVQNYEDDQNFSEPILISLIFYPQNQSDQLIQQVESVVSVYLSSQLQNQEPRNNTVDENAKNKSTIEEKPDKQDKKIVLESLVRNIRIEIDSQILSQMENENICVQKYLKKEEKKAPETSEIENFHFILEMIFKHKIQSKEKEKIADGIIFNQSYLYAFFHKFNDLNDINISQNKIETIELIELDKKKIKKQQIEDLFTININALTKEDKKLKKITDIILNKNFLYEPIMEDFQIDELRIFNENVVNLISRPFFFNLLHELRKKPISLFVKYFKEIQELLKKKDKSEKETVGEKEENFFLINESALNNISSSSTFQENVKLKKLRAQLQMKQFIIRSFLLYYVFLINQKRKIIMKL